MTTKFLGSADTGDLTNGSVAINARSLTASNLSASSALKTNGIGTIVSSDLLIADVDGLAAALTSASPFSRTGTTIAPKTSGDDLAVDEINEQTVGAGVTIETVVIKDGIVTGASDAAPTTDAQLANKKYVDDSILSEDFWDRSGTTIQPKVLSDDLAIDFIGEQSVGAGVSITNTLHVDTIEEDTPAAGVTIDGITLKDDTISATGAYTTIDDAWFSDISILNTGTRIISGCVVTQNAGGGSNIDITAGEVLIRPSNDETVAPVRVTTPSVTNQAVTAATAIFVYYDYTLGWQYSATEPAEYNTNVVASIVFYDSDISEMHLCAGCNTNTNSADVKAFWRHGQTERFRHVPGGMILGETGTRNVTISAGTLYVVLTPAAYSAFDTSAADTFVYYYGSSPPTAVTAQTQYDNTQYDNAGVLTDLTANQYGVTWFYSDSDGHIGAVYGKQSYLKLSDAQASSEPDSTQRPPWANELGFLIGRIIVKKSAATATQIDYLNGTTFGGTGINDHGELNGLGDDDHTQYFNATRMADGTLTAVGIGDANTGSAILEVYADGTVPVDIYRNSSSTGTVLRGLELHRTADTTPTAGIGVSIAFRPQDDGGSPESAAELSGFLTDVSAAAEQGTYRVQVCSDSSLTPAMDLIAATGNDITAKIYGKLQLGSSTIVDGIIDDDSMATASATALATSESIKAYVDAQVGGENIWNRSGTDITPTNAGDALRISDISPEGTDTGILFSPNVNGDCYLRMQRTAVSDVNQLDYYTGPSQRYSWGFPASGDFRLQCYGSGTTPMSFNATDGVASIQEGLAIGGTTSPTYGKVLIQGTDSDRGTGPHMYFQTAADAYPQMGILAYNHTNHGILFNAYYDATGYLSSGTQGNVLLEKGNGNFTINVDDNIAAGGTITWDTALSIDTGTTYINIPSRLGVGTTTAPPYGTVYCRATPSGTTFPGITFNSNTTYNSGQLYYSSATDIRHYFGCFHDGSQERSSTTTGCVKFQQGSNIFDISYDTAALNTAPIWNVGIRMSSVNGAVAIPTVYNNSITGRDVFITSSGELGYNSSMQAHKMDITTIDNANILYSLSPKRFHRRCKTKDGEMTDIPEKEWYYGFIAEEVEAVDPSLCFYDHYDLVGDNVDTSEMTTHPIDDRLVEKETPTLAGVKMKDMTGLIVKALQEQHVEIGQNAADIGELVSPTSGYHDMLLIKSVPTYSNLVSGGRDVMIDSNGFLGYESSLRAHKTNIKDIQTNPLMGLEPVQFNRKKTRPVKIDDMTIGVEITEETESETEYGFIAEDVHEVDKNLCIYNPHNGELEGVRMNRMIPLLVKTIQEQQGRIEILEEENKVLRAQDSLFEQRMKIIDRKLEALKKLEEMLTSAGQRYQ